MSIAAIPTELNCADVGTKSLTKKRLFGLLYMMKVIDSISDRVGREECMDIEYQYQKRSSSGTSVLMASEDTVAGESMDYETGPNAYKFEWWALILCALVGALSVLRWLRYIGVKFMKSMLTWESDVGMIREIKNSEEKRSSQDQEVQVTQWLECSLWLKYEEQIHDMEDRANGAHEELLRAEGLIEGLKVD